MLLGGWGRWRGLTVMLANSEIRTCVMTGWGTWCLHCASNEFRVSVISSACPFSPEVHESKNKTASPARMPPTICPTGRLSRLQRYSDYRCCLLKVGGRIRGHWSRRQKARRRARGRFVDESIINGNHGQLCQGTIDTVKAWKEFECYTKLCCRWDEPPVVSMESHLVPESFLHQGRRWSSRAKAIRPRRRNSGS